MIERIVLFKLKSSLANEVGRREVVAATKESLRALDGLETFTVGVPADGAAEKSWDVSLVLRFRDHAALEAFQRDPAHRAYMDEVIGSKTEVVKSWNFDVG